MKPQDVYILSQSAKHQAMLHHIIAVILDTVPEASLEFKYLVPYFYYNKKPLCYLHANKKRDFIDVGFAKGFLLKENQQALVIDGRNTIKSLRYFSFEAIDNDIIKSVLLEAEKL